MNKSAERSGAEGSFNRNFLKRNDLGWNLRAERVVVLLNVYWDFQTSDVWCWKDFWPKVFVLILGKVRRFSLLDLRERDRWKIMSTGERSGGREPSKRPNASDELCILLWMWQVAGEVETKKWHGLPSISRKQVLQRYFRFPEGEEALQMANQQEQNYGSQDEGRHKLDNGTLMRNDLAEAIFLSSKLASLQT